MTCRLLALSVFGPLVLVVGVLAGCGPTGGTVRVGEHGIDTFLAFDAAAGKNNVVTVTENGPTVIISDAGDRIIPGEGCTSVDSDTASCTRPDVITMNLGDEDDEATNGTDIRSTLHIFGTEVRGIRGGPGNDTLHGGTVADLLVGDEGEDLLQGNQGDDVLHEGSTAASTDVLDADTYEGGSGVDFASYALATQNVFVTLNGSSDDGRRDEGDLVTADIEKLIGGSGNDGLRGDADANSLFGGGGNDLLTGEAGADRLAGEFGDDTLVEGASAASTDVLDADSFEGGPGIDRVRYVHATFGVRIDIDTVSDDGRTGEGDNVRFDVEDLDGGQAGDTLIGDAEANRITGQPGDDRLEGLAGNDTLAGGTGFDKLIGGTETDDCDVGLDGGTEETCET